MVTENVSNLRPKAGTMRDALQTQKPTIDNQNNSHLSC